MRRRIFNIFTLTLLATVFGQGITYAQEEGGELPVKPESTVVAKDSIQDEIGNAGEAKNDFLNSIVITPKIKTLGTTDIELNPLNTVVPKKPTLGSDKAKEEETQSSFRFNFIYYLFYKFKVGSSSSGDN